MKIGIMTLWFYKNNYGSVLQCYALQKYLQDMGHDAFLIRYYPKNSSIIKGIISNKKWFFKKIINCFNPMKVYNFVSYKWLEIQATKADTLRGFDEFRDRYIRHSLKIYYSYDELKNAPPIADVYIVGSDQVWNTNDEDNIKAFCLDFGDKNIRRIAWAASFGGETISDVLMQKMSPLLKQFEFVSTREESGIEICRKCGIRDVKVVMDPTILLDANIYRLLYENTISSITKQKSKYCFIYLIDEKHNYLMVKKIYKWAKKKKLAIIYITGNLRYNIKSRIYATIPEWIYLLENSEYVITDSYHGAIFSLIFHKNFLIIPRSIKRQNDRFFSLFTSFGIEYEYFTDNIDNSLQKNQMRWDKIDNKINNIKKSCELYEIIEGNINACDFNNCSSL